MIAGASGRGTVSFSETDHALMAEALRLAWLGRDTVTPNPAVGCVIARDGRAVGRGWHRRAGEPHAEVHALREAGGAAVGGTAYVTMEPCSITRRTPPCTDALINAGLRRVVFAMQDPNPSVDGRGAAALREAGLTVESGLMADAAMRLNEGFALRMRRGRPFVTLTTPPTCAAPLTRRCPTPMILTRLATCTE